MSGWDDIPDRQDGPFVRASWFNSIKNKMKELFGVNSWFYINADETLGAGGQITIANAKWAQEVHITSTTGHVDLALLPFGNAFDLPDRSIIRIWGDSAAGNSLTLKYNDNDYGYIGKGDMRVEGGDCITLVWFKNKLRFRDASRNV